MNDTRHVKGLSALQKVYDTLPAKIQRNHLRGALRAGMNAVKPEAQSRIHNVSGQLSRGLKVGTRARGSRVTASLKATGLHAHVAHWIEYGVKAHTIVAKVKKALSFGGTVTKSVQHPGFSGTGFMRRSLDAKATAAVIAAGNYMKNRLASKHGIDTAHITVEGDE